MLVGFGIVRCVVVLVVLGIFCILVIGVGVGWVSEGGCRFPLPMDYKDILTSMQRPLLPDDDTEAKREA